MAITRCINAAGVAIRIGAGSSTSLYKPSSRPAIFSGWGERFSNGSTSQEGKRCTRFCSGASARFGAEKKIEIFVEIFGVARARRHDQNRAARPRGDQRKHQRAGAALKALNTLAAGPGPVEKAVQPVGESHGAHEKKLKTLQFDFWNARRRRRDLCDFRRLGPGLGTLAKILHIDLQECRLIVFQADKRLVDHPHRSLDLGKIAEQAKCRSQTDQPFEKGLILVGGVMIKPFQNFVGFEEFPAVE